MSDNVLTVSLIQYAPCWEDVPRNLSRLDGMLRTLAGKTDLVVLPEMFSTGFGMNTELVCRNADSFATLQWMRYQAVSVGAMVAGSMAAVEDGRCLNRFCWVSPDGIMGHYDKRHLFTVSGESQHFAAGTEQKRFEWRGWEMKPIVCYDLRFPAWCRNSRTKPYDLLICPASWPQTRSDAWLTLLKARALENQCYVMGVNRVGTDGNGLSHTGDSVVYGPKGNVVGQLPENREMIATFSLSLAELHDFRRRFPILDDMDNIIL